MKTKERCYPQTHDEREKWLSERISLCQDATRDIKKINEWVSERSAQIQSLASRDTRSLMNS